MKILKKTQKANIDKGIVQHYREAVEMYKYQHLGLALNRDSDDRISMKFNI